MTGELWVAVAALAVAALIGIVMGRRLVRFTLEVFGLRVGAERDRSEGGVEVVRSRAGRHIIADNHGDGGVRIHGSSAEGDIRASAAKSKDGPASQPQKEPRGTETADNTTERKDAWDPFASVQRSRAGRDIVVNLYANVPPPLRRHLRERDFLPLIDDRTRGFVGRRFVVDELLRHLEDNAFPSGYVVVEGEPGIGKTALAAHLVAEHGWLHHFNIAAANIRSPSAFIGNLSAQLISRFDLGIDQLPEHAVHDSGFLSGLLNDATAAAERPVVVVVDALDEAEPASVQSGANRLLLPTVLPRGVYFLVTTRPQHDDQLYAEQIRSVVIADDDPRNLSDLRVFAEAHTQANEQALAPLLADWNLTRHGLVDRLVDSSEGNFQYLRLVLADLVAGNAPRHAGDLPRGLVRYYRRHLTMMRSESIEEYRRLQRPVLCYLVSAQQPVPVDRIAGWAGVARQEVVDALRRWLPFLNRTTGSDGETLYSIYHRSFAEFLAEEEDLVPFHDRIAEMALLKRSSPPNNGTGTCS